MKSFLEQYGLSEEEINLVMNLATEVKVKANQQLFQADKVFDKFWFIKEGIIRSYRLIEGDDFTYSFFLPGDLCVDYESYLKASISNHYFEALSDSVYLQFEKGAIEALFEAHPRIERIARVMAEKAYLRAVERLKEFQTDSLEDRYLNLISQNHILFQAAPLQYIASFLGVKPQSLSRIRAKIANKHY